MSVRLDDAIALRAFFLARAGRRPQLLVIDDADDADEPSAAALAWLARAVTAAPLVVLSTCRTAAAAEPRPAPPGTLLPLPELAADGTLKGNVLRNGSPSPITAVKQ